MGEGVTAASAVASNVTMIMATVTAITANVLVAAVVAMPLTKKAVAAAKRLFK